MGLSHPLSRVARHLLYDPSGSVQVFVHERAAAAGGRDVVVCAWDRDGKRLKASASAFGRIEAFVKAMAELGEAIISDAAGFADRTGLAGGLFAANAEARAKAELLERDAFLHHYRTGTPFLAASRAPGTALFEMMSADPGFHCALAIDEAWLEGAADCLLLGLGCGPDRRTAESKAAAELAVMALDHQLRPGWCAEIHEGRTSPARKTDMHHAASRDPRIAERMRRLCRAQALAPRRPSLEGAWRIDRLDSPVRYLTYVKATHEGLLRLEFGKPEPCEDGPPLYHPIW